MKGLSCGLAAILLVMSTVACVPGPTTQQHLEAATWLGVVGAGVGALIDNKNPWRGAVVGAAIGSVAGYGLAEITQRAAEEAAQRRQTVTYHNPRTNEWVQADPVSYQGQTATVRTRTYQGQQMTNERYMTVPAY